MQANQPPLDVIAVTEVATAVPAFIGYTQKAKKLDTDLTRTPVLISSLVEYTEYFGVAENENNIEVVLSGTAAATSVAIQFTPGTTGSAHNMYYALQSYFQNGGSDCYIVSAGPTSALGLIDQVQLKMALDVLQNEQQPTLIIFPEAVQGLNDADYGLLISAALAQCKASANRFAILDVKSDNTRSINDNAAVFRNLVTGIPDLLSYGAAYFPYVKTTFNYSYVDAGINIIDKRSATVTTTRLSDLQMADNMLYGQVKKELSNFYMFMPPAAFAAGAYSATDQSRGVWKAPANIRLNKVTDLSEAITDADNQKLNIDENTGISINALRQFAGRGILIWGARTLSGNDNEWRYISVRRFCNSVTASVKNAVQQFAPAANNSDTWTAVTAMVNNYLFLLWRQGALMGSTSKEAFFVKTGLGTTMTADDILNGKLIIEIGMAVVRPAEFIILRLCQKMQQA